MGLRFGGIRLATERGTEGGSGDHRGYGPKNASYVGFARAEGPELR